MTPAPVLCTAGAYNISRDLGAVCRFECLSVVDGPSLLYLGATSCGCYPSQEDQVEAASDQSEGMQMYIYIYI